MEFVLSVAIEGLIELTERNPIDYGMYSVPSNILTNTRNSMGLSNLFTPRN